MYPKNAPLSVPRRCVAFLDDGDAMARHPTFGGALFPGGRRMSPMFWPQVGEKRGLIPLTSQFCNKNRPKIIIFQNLIPNILSVLQQAEELYSNTPK